MLIYSASLGGDVCIEKLNMSSCKCESLSDKERIRCLAEHFNKLMIIRERPLSRQQLQSIYDTTRLADVVLMQFEPNSATEEFAESQILYTFVSEYCRNHPRFQHDGPCIGDLKLKTTFFQAT